MQAGGQVTEVNGKEEVVCRKVEMPFHSATVHSVMY